MGLRVWTIKGYFTLPISLELNTHHQIQFSVVPRTPFFRWSYSSLEDTVSTPPSEPTDRRQSSRKKTKFNISSSWLGVTRYAWCGVIIKWSVVDCNVANGHWSSSEGNTKTQHVFALGPSIVLFFPINLWGRGSRKKWTTGNTVDML